MLQLGFVSAILPELSLDEVLAVAKQFGYSCVEVMCWPPGKADRRYAGVTHLDAADFGPEQAAAVRERIARHCVSISGLGYYPNPLCADRAEGDRYVEHIRRVIRAASLLGVPRMNTFVGRNPALSVAGNWDRFREVWPGIIRYAEEHRVNVGIENCPMLFTNDEWPGGKNLAVSPAIWRKMFAEIPSPNFGLNYDPSHLVWQQMDYLSPIREFASRLHHIHAKDVRLDRHKLNEVGILATPNEYHTPKLPGLGDVNWGAFFSTLTDAGYRGPVCVEVEDRAYEGPLENRLASLKQSAAYLRQFVPG
jgi:sugar phosphate isomerase/epimerase